MGLLALSSRGDAADRYWAVSGATPANWNVTTSWSTTSGGATGASVPGIADHAIFDGARTAPCIINSVVSIASMTISTSNTGGYSGYIDASTRTITIRGDFTLNRGTFYGRTSSITVQGNWIADPASNFVANTSSVTFTGGVNKLIDTGGRQFYKLIFAGVGAQSYRTSDAPVTISSHVLVLSGSYLIGGSSVTVAGGFTVSAGATTTINHDLEVDGGSLFKFPSARIASNSTSTVRLSGTGLLGGTSIRMMLPNLEMSGAGTTTLAGGLTLNGSLLNDTGHTFDPSASNFNITLADNWINHGTYVMRTASVTFNGSTADDRIDTSNSPIYLLQIVGTGSWMTEGGPVTVSNNFVISRGTFTVAGGSSLTVTTDLQNTGGMVDFQGDALISGGDLTNVAGGVRGFSTATVTLNGAGTLGGTGLTILPNLTLTGAATTTTLGGRVFILGALNNSASHTFDPSGTSYSITISGNWNNAGTYTMRAASVTFNGAIGIQTITTNNSPFYNLVFERDGNAVNGANPITVSSTVFVNDGEYRVARTSLTVVGDINIRNGAIFDIDHDVMLSGGDLNNLGTITSLSTPTVRMTGAGILGGTGGPTNLPHLTLFGASQATTLASAINVNSLNNGGSHTLDVSASNYSITVSSSWTNLGIYNARGGSVTFTSSIANTRVHSGIGPFYNAVFQGVGSWINVSSAVTVASNVFVNNGTLNIVGSSFTIAGDLDVLPGATLDIENETRFTNGSLFNEGTVIAHSTGSITMSGSALLGGPGTTTLPRVTLLGNAQTTTLGGAVVFIGSMTNAVNHIFDADGYQITMSSHWVNLSTFTASNNTVIFDVSASLMGRTTFYNLTAVTPAIDLTIQANTTQYVMNTLTITGSAGNEIGLFSSTPGTNWYLDVEGSASVSRADVRDSDARPGLMITPANSINSGNNRNWNFGGANLRTWWGGSSTDWFTPGNWDSLVPTSADSVLIVSTATRMPTLTNNVQISSLTVRSGSSVTLAGFDLRLSSFSNAGNVLLRGTEFVSTAIDSVANSTVTYNAPSGNSVIFSTWTYMGLAINGGPAAIYTPTGNITIGRSFTITAGILEHDGETFTFTSTAAAQSITTSGDPFYNVTFNGTGGYWTLTDSMTVLNDMTLTAGTLDTRANLNHGIALGGNFIETAGVFVTRNSSVTLAGTTTTGRIRSGNSQIWKLVVNGPGDWRLDTDPLTVSSMVVINGGSFLVGGASLTVTTDIDVNGGTFEIDHDVLISGGDLPNNGTILTDLSTPTVTLPAAGILGGPGHTRLPRLTTAGSFVTTLGGHLTLMGTMTNATGHTLDASTNNFGITAMDEWLNSGIYTARLSSVTFAGSGLNERIQTNHWLFYNLRFNGSGSWVHITNPVTVSSSVWVTAGLYQVMGTSLSVTGDIDVIPGASMEIDHNIMVTGGDLITDGTLTSLSTPIVTLNGAGSLGGLGSSTFPQVTMSGAGTTNLNGAVVFLGSTTIGTGHTLDVTTNNYNITISSWWANNGLFTARQGTVVLNANATLTGSTTFYNFTAVTPGVTLTFQSGTTQYITNILDMQGTIGSRILLRPTIASAYTFRVSISSYVRFVDVQRCVASSQTIYAGQTSTNGGNNGNWVFDFPPNAITNLLATRQLTGDIRLTWSAPSDEDDSPLPMNSQYMIHWATYTATWSTSTLNDTGQALTKHISITTGPVSAGTFQVYLSTGLTGNVSYYYQIWTKDALGQWSGLSNNDFDFATPVLGLDISPSSYDFGAVPVNTSTSSITGITVTQAGNLEQTYSLRVSSATDWIAKTATPAAMDQFVMFGLFNATQPPLASFAADDVIISTPTASSASVYSSGGQNGLLVPAGAVRNLWLRFTMPTSTSTEDPQSMTLSVTGSAP